MKTILDDECRGMLLRELKELGFKNANTIVEEKYKSAVYEEALKIMKNFVEHFEQKRYKEAYDMLEFSPAGDGWGTDNYYLSFKNLGKNFEDINDVIDFLMK